MLTEQQMEHIAKPLTEHYQRLENEILSSISNGISRTLKVADTIVEEKIVHLQELGFEDNKVRSEINKQLSTSATFNRKAGENAAQVKKDIDHAIKVSQSNYKTLLDETVQRAVAETWKNETELYLANGLKVAKNMPKQFQQALVKNISGDLKNLTKTSALGVKTSAGKIVAVQKVYQKELDYALIKYTSGTETLNEAIKGTVKNLSKSGVRSTGGSKVSYRTTTRQLDSAIRNSLITTSNRIAGNVTQSNIEDLGVEYVEVSTSMSPRPSHAEWEGQVYTLEEFKRVCHYGDETNPDAIYSYNCQHNHYPYFKGTKRMDKGFHYSPKTIDGKEYQAFELTQKQRNMERGIRDLKRENNILKSIGADNKDVSLQIMNKTDNYKAFSKSIGISAKTDRLRVYS